MLHRPARPGGGAGCAVQKMRPAAPGGFDETVSTDHLSPWLREWDRAQQAYFGPRHQAAHFAALADSLVPLLPAGGTVLDFGPGDALHAEAVAARCSRLLLCESAPSIRAALAARPHPDAVAVIGPADLDELPPGSVDLVLAQSVFQYLTAEEVEDFLATASRLLAPEGRLLVGDLLSPGTGVLTDVAELLRFAAREGFLRDALRHLVRLPLTPYQAVRHRNPLASYTSEGLAATLARHGLRAERLDRNLGYHRRRWTLSAHHPAPDGDPPPPTRR